MAMNDLRLRVEVEYLQALVLLDWKGEPEEVLGVSLRVRVNGDPEWRYFTKFLDEDAGPLERARAVWVPFERIAGGPR